MTNLLDYLRWRGDLPFERDGFNEIDLLIFAQLAHTPMENLTKDHTKTHLPDLTDILYPTPPEGDKDSLPVQRYGLWKELIQTRRYASVSLRRFAARFVPKEEKQFAAALYAVNGVGVVAFRGTDATLVGWKEDFNMGFESPIPSQTEAVRFLETCAGDFDRLVVCGHSKGGNLAMYASAMCRPEVQDQIISTFSYDGPGMDDATLQSDGWNRIASRIHSYIPESSVIGLLLGHAEQHIIIQSDSTGIGQHNPYYWHILGPAFVRAEETTLSSRIMEETTHRFISNCTPEERRVLINNVFSVLNATGARRLKELPMGLLTHLDAVTAAFRDIPEEDRKMAGELLKMLAQSGGNSALSFAPGLWDKLLKICGIGGN